MEVIRILAKVLLIIYGLFLGTCLGIAIVENLRKDKDKKRWKKNT